MDEKFDQLIDDDYEDTSSPQKSPFPQDRNISDFLLELSSLKISPDPSTKIPCIMNKKNILNSQLTYYTCSCFLCPKMGENICSECIMNCHKGHSGDAKVLLEKTSNITEVFCSCAEHSHKTNTIEKENKVSSSKNDIQCNVNEILYFSNVDTYYMDPNTHMYYCLFCFENCLGEQKKDYIVVDSKKFALVQPICACSNKKNHSSIADNAFCLENILNEKNLNKNCDLCQIPGNIIYRNDMQEKYVKPIKDLHNILLEAYGNKIVSEKEHKDLITKSYKNSMGLLKSFTKAFNGEIVYLNNNEILKCFNFNFIKAIFPEVTKNLPTDFKNDTFLIETKTDCLMFFRVYFLEPVTGIIKKYDLLSDVENSTPILRLISRLDFNEVLEKLKINKQDIITLFKNIYDTIVRYNENLIEYNLQDAKLVSLIIEVLNIFIDLSSVRYTQKDDVNFLNEVIVNYFNKLIEISSTKKPYQKIIKSKMEKFTKIIFIYLNDEIFYREVICPEENKIEGELQDANTEVEKKNKIDIAAFKNFFSNRSHHYASSSEQFIELEEENIPNQNEEFTLKNSYLDSKFAFEDDEIQKKLIYTLFAYKRETKDKEPEFERWQIYDWIINEKDYYIEALECFIESKDDNFTISDLNNLMLPLALINVRKIFQNQGNKIDIERLFSNLEDLRDKYFNSNIRAKEFLEKVNKELINIKELIKSEFDNQNLNINNMQLYIFKIGFFDLIYSFYNIFNNNPYLITHLSENELLNLNQNIFDVLEQFSLNNALLLPLFFTRKSIALFLKSENKELKKLELSFYLKIIYNLKRKNIKLNSITYANALSEIYKNYVDILKKEILNNFDNPNLVDGAKGIIPILKSLSKCLSIVTKKTYLELNTIILNLLNSLLTDKYYYRIWGKYISSFDESLIQEEEDNPKKIKKDEKDFIHTLYKLVLKLGDYHFYILTDNIQKYDMKRILEEKINSMEPNERRIISMVYSRYFVVSPFNLLLKMSNSNMDIMVELPDNNLNGKVIATNRDELLSPRKKDESQEIVGGLFGKVSPFHVVEKKKELGMADKAFSFLKVLKIGELSLGLDPIYMNLSKFKRISKLYLNTYYKQKPIMFIKYFLDVIVIPSAYSLYKVLYFTPVFSAKYKYMAYKIVYLFLECYKYFVETVLGDHLKFSENEEYKKMIDDMFFKDSKSKEVTDVLKNLKEKLMYDVPKIGKDPKFEPLKIRTLLDYYCKYIKQLKLLSFLPLELGGKSNNMLMELKIYEENNEDEINRNENNQQRESREFREKMNSFLTFYYESKENLDENVMINIFTQPVSEEDVKISDIKSNIALDLLFRIDFKKGEKEVYNGGKENYYELTNCINKIYKADPDFWHDIIVDIAYHTKQILRDIIKGQLTFLIQFIYIDFHKLSVEKLNNVNQPRSIQNFLILLEYLRLHCENHHKIFQTVLTNANITKVNANNQPDRLDFLNFILKIPVMAMNSVNYAQSKRDLISLFKEENYDYFNTLLTGITDYLIEIIQGSFEQNMKRFSLEEFKQDKELLNKNQSVQTERKSKSKKITDEEQYNKKNFYPNEDFDNYIDAGYLCFDNLENKESEFFLSQFFRFIICFFEECLNPTSNKEKIVKKFNPKKLLVGLSHSTANLYLHYKDNKMLTNDYVLPDKFADELVNYYLTEESFQENHFFILSSNIIRFFKIATQWKSGDKILQMLNEIKNECDEDIPLGEKNKNYNIGKRESYRFFSKIVKEVEVFYKPKENLSELERRKFKEFFDSNDVFEKEEESFRELMQFKGNVQKVVYLVHPDSLFVQENDMIRFKNSAPFDKNEKLNFVLQYLPQFESDIQMRQNLWERKNKFLNILYLIDYRYTSFISIFLAVVVNIVILMSFFYEGKTYTIPGEKEGEISIKWTRKELNSRYIFLISLAHLFFISITIVNWVYFTLLKIRDQDEKVSVIEFLYNAIFDSDIGCLIWNLIVGLIAMISIHFHFIYSMQLFTVFTLFETMQTVIYSVRIRYRQFLSAGLLMMIFSMFFAMVKFYWFTNKDSEECVTYGQCFLSIVTDGIRGGGGMGFPTKKITDEQYYSEFIFEWFFYFSIILILLNVINSIIVDTFQALREEANAQYETKMNICFICSLNRNVFDRKGIDFDYHKEHEHNILNYFLYLYKIIKTDEQELNSLDYQVLLSYRQTRTDFFPVNTAISINSSENN